MVLSVWSNGLNMVVAEDEADARELLAAYLGEDAAKGAEWRRLDATKELSIYADVPPLLHGEECDHCGVGVGTSENGHHSGCPIGCPTKTAAEWAASNGRGYLCSTET